MSYKTMAGAAVMALTSFFTTSANAEKTDTTSDLDISGTLTYLQESIKSGDVNFNPMNEVALTVKSGKNWQANFSYDIRTNEAFDFDGGRIETASLTYKRNNWSITGGLLGEQHLRGLYFAPGGAPDVMARENAYNLRVDRDDIVGIKFETGNNNWGLEGSAFAALDPHESTSGIVKRGNSSDISYRLRGTLRTSDKSSVGIEGGKNESINGAAETFVGAFADTSLPLNDNLTWNASGEVIYFENIGNVDGRNRNLAMAYTDLTRKFGERASGWVQAAVNIDDVNEDLAVLEVGVKFIAHENDGKRLSFFLRADLERELSGYQHTDWGAQGGMRYEF